MIEHSKILWSKLPVRELECEPYQKRVLEYDPYNAQNCFKPKPHSRIQNVSVLDLFPSQGELCSCGCGKKLTGRQWLINQKKKLNHKQLYFKDYECRDI